MAEFINHNIVEEVNIINNQSIPYKTSSNNKNNNNIKEFLNFQIHRKLTDVTKNFLFILEDLIDDGYKISDEKFIRIRKRCLDSMNDAGRDLSNTLDKLDIKISSLENIKDKNFK